MHGPFRVRLRADSTETAASVAIGAGSSCRSELLLLTEPAEVLRRCTSAVSRRTFLSVVDGGVVGPEELATVGIHSSKFGIVYEVRNPTVGAELDPIHRSAQTS